MRLGGHDFLDENMVVVCGCVAEGRPVGIYQHASDSLSMVCGVDHGPGGLMNICLHHLQGRPELASLPRVDEGYGAYRDDDSQWYIFEDNEDA